MAIFTWGTIKDWNGDDLNATIQGLAENRRKAAYAHDDIGRIDVKSGWEGEGAHAAGDALGKLKDGCAHYLGLIGDLIQATATAQDGVNEVKAMVAEILALAAEYDFIIGDDGSVRSTSIQEEPILIETGMPDLSPVKLAECAEMIKHACEKAAEVDSAYTGALGAVSEGKDSDPEGFDDPTPGLPDLPKEGASTEEVAAWWYSLSGREREKIRDEAKEDIKAGRPTKYEALGNMDGIDARTRNEINVTRLDRDIEALEKEKGEILNDSSNKITQRAKLDYVEQRLEEAKGIKSAVGDGTSDVGLYLYEPATGEDGHEATHAALAVGNIDDADNVTTYTPGMTTSVKGSEGLVADMKNLKDRAEAEGKGSVAAIAWVGYDAPPSPQTADFSVVSTHDAELGGNSLAKHLEGIEDSRAALKKPVHQSVLGHSYGSTTSSYGVAQVRPGVVDDYAVFGSPGVKDTAEAMHVPEGHSFAMLYNGDSGGKGDIITPFNEIGGFFKGTSGALGMNPVDPSSGFRVMDPGDSGASSRSGAHMRYLDEGTQAQSILAKVVAGTAG